MNLFSRSAIIRALGLLGKVYEYHNQVDYFCLLFGLEDVAPRDIGAIRTRLLRITEHLIQNRDAKGPDGANLIFEVIEYILIQADSHSSTDLPKLPEYVALENSLRRDGFIIEDNQIRSSLPETTQLPEKENELFSLLDKFKFDTEKGHIEQAISAHTRGEWAAANAQFRSFMEGLFDSIAEKLAPNKDILPETGHLRRNWLFQNPAPTFFQADLNEWKGDGKGFVEGLFKRLHPQGSHPGLSDEEDSTFRLHIVLLTALHYLRRLSERV